MDVLPTLQGDDVVLRAFRLDDAPVVERLAGAREVADTTLTIPHPYPPGAAESWIATHQPVWEEGTGATWAITSRADDVLGAIGLTIARDHGSAELGYWVGVPYWNKGICTQAGRLVLRFAFEELHLHRVYAQYLTRNPQSGRVMQKIGMTEEGVHRDAVRKWDRFEDLASYAILESDWRGAESLGGSS